jgi:hypothetical protein
VPRSDAWRLAEVTWPQRHRIGSMINEKWMEKLSHNRNKKQFLNSAQKVWSRVKKPQPQRSARSSQSKLTLSLIIVSLHVILSCVIVIKVGLGMIAKLEIVTQYIIRAAGVFKYRAESLASEYAQSHARRRKPLPLQIHSHSR